MLNTEIQGLLWVLVVAIAIFSFDKNTY